MQIFLQILKDGPLTSKMSSKHHPNDIKEINEQEIITEMKYYKARLWILLPQNNWSICNCYLWLGFFFVQTRKVFYWLMLFIVSTKYIRKLQKPSLCKIHDKS